jgi:hypothetical protein
VVVPLPSLEIQVNSAELTGIDANVRVALQQHLSVAFGGTGGSFGGQGGHGHIPLSMLHDVDVREVYFSPVRSRMVHSEIYYPFAFLLFISHVSICSFSRCQPEAVSVIFVFANVAILSC